MDTLSPKDRSERMSRVRSTGSKPEMAVRRLVHGLGYRYRLHVKGIPGRPDLVFRSRRKVIFVHGCFWHRHPGCAQTRMPKSRLDFWKPKLERNRERDREVQEAVHNEGWSFLVVWECEVRDVEELTYRIHAFLR